MSTLRSRMVAAALCCAPLAAAAAPLEATTLYRDKAIACRTLALAPWKHPTRDVLEDAHVPIGKIELCNGDVYPVFTVRFPASPLLGVNDRFFNKLFARLFVANGYNPFAVVDPGWGVVVFADRGGKRELLLSYDDFDAQDVN